ncbi:MAG: thioredoxin family protein [Ichthyobacteriaceae bacterium]|nr:thioredoxin family protein [Ichthyobacteriaceae bacterium]
MKNLLVVALFMLFGLTSNIKAQTDTDYVITDEVANEGWNNNANEVFKTAKKNNSPILMNFTGSDWCKWCIKIKKEIFDTPEFKTWAKKKNLQLLELDFPRRIQQTPELKSQNSQLAKELNVRGYPTLYIISDGKLIKSGYVAGGPKAWIESVESQM